MPIDRSLIRCAAILFDLDGVLVDSSACVEKSWRDWAVRRRLDPDRVMEVAHGRRSIETVQLVAPHLNAADEAAAIAAVESTTTDGVFEVPGARALLERLPSNAWAIVTSGVRAVATLRIRHTRLPVPEVLVPADEIQRGKPHPEGYLTAATRLGVDPAMCIVVEDTPAGLEAARAAGMRSVAVSGTYPAAALTIADITVPRLDALRIESAGCWPPVTIHLSRE
ncbi:MAG TPA: HAD-IA family hydrolase [Gemmatimonadaceae bacterium]|nr:HAD-IA family hydrolase [Gemmatimonadaceae bacterium]